MISEAAPNYRNTPLVRAAYCRTPEDPSEPPFVSIVTPYFNSTAVFPETIRTVFSQSFQQWEWIIVDDGSTEPTDLLESLRARDQRVRVISVGENRGPSAARNAGYREAQCEFVFQLDSDDLIEPTTIEKLVWALLAHPEWSFAATSQVGFQENEYLNASGFHLRERFLSENYINPTALVRRAVHGAVEGYDEALRDGLEDWEFWLRCAARGYWGGTVPEFLVWYRWRDRPLARWKNWGEPARREAFRRALEARYPQLFAGNFPKLELRPRGGRIATGEVPGLRNFLRRETRRIVIVANGDEPGLEAVLQRFSEREAECSLLALNQLGSEPLHRFSRWTPDLFSLPNFLVREEAVRFFSYFIRSRACDVVVFGATPLSYRLLPIVPLSLPGAQCVDVSASGGMTVESLQSLGL